MDRRTTPDAREAARALLVMTPAEFAEELKATPLSRAKLVGLKRNAASVLANVGTPGLDVDGLRERGVRRCGGSHGGGVVSEVRGHGDD
ncbi:MAG TPA: hypothetical protein VIK25_12445 [Gemmatimonadaceae bacterium]